MSAQHPIVIAVGGPLNLESVDAVARRGATVTIAPEGAEALIKARAVIEALLVGDAPATYGINTGFGALAEVRIPDDQLVELQHNLIRSHAVGVGAPLAEDATRAMMLLRAHVMALGYSGARPLVVETLVNMLNARVHPIIPAQGSVGACGDLAPLAHLALVLIGEGRARYQGELMEGGAAMAAAGIAPITLKPKEGLALINGTQGMMAVGGLALFRALRLAQCADITGAMSLEALKGSVRAFDPMVIAARPHPGALSSAAHLRALLADSPIAESHSDCGEVQDAYSLRCMPQVHGAARDGLTWCAQVLGIELMSATDNPLVLPDGRIQSGGNFHGQPVALALDLATAAVTDLASISERRIAQLVDPSLNRGLPPFLAVGSGLHSGFMMAQVTAASLVSESKALSHPKSVDSIPTSADREDHVSMGMISARHFEQTVTHLSWVLAIEAVVAGHALDLLEVPPAPGVERARACLRTVVPPVTGDRAFHRDFEAARVLLDTGLLLAEAACA